MKQIRNINSWIASGFLLTVHSQWCAFVELLLWVNISCVASFTDHRRSWPTICWENIKIRKTSLSSSTWDFNEILLIEISLMSGNILQLAFYFKTIPDCAMTSHLNFRAKNFKKYLSAISSIQIFEFSRIKLLSTGFQQVLNGKLLIKISNFFCQNNSSNWSDISNAKQKWKQTITNFFAFSDFLIIC